MSDLIETTNEIDTDFRALRDDELDAVSGGQGVDVCYSSNATSIVFKGVGTLTFSTDYCGEPPRRGYPTARWSPA
jgi:hypothetical protein